jgi:hypothetical protein
MQRVVDNYGGPEVLKVVGEDSPDQARARCQRPRGFEPVTQS